jgi:hypothetical protein
MLQQCDMKSFLRHYSSPTMPKNANFQRPEKIKNFKTRKNLKTEIKHDVSFFARVSMCGALTPEQKSLLCNGAGSRIRLHGDWCNKYMDAPNGMLSSGKMHNAKNRCIFCALGRCQVSKQIQLSAANTRGAVPENYEVNN